MEIIVAGAIVIASVLISFSIDRLADAYIKGYEQAEKDIWAAIEKYLSKRDTRDYSTVGWILKHLDEYKKAIMEEE